MRSMSARRYAVAGAPAATSMQVCIVARLGIDLRSILAMWLIEGRPSAGAMKRSWMVQSV
eukprot:3931769-Rhodomonas_salina.1